MSESELPIEIDQLVRPLATLFRQVKPGLAKNRWGSMIIEGKGAIVPGLIFKQLIAMSGGSPALNVIAIESPIWVREPVLKVDLQSELDLEHFPKRSLIFTEFVYEGRATSKLSRILGELGAAADVAATFISQSPANFFEAGLFTPGTAIYVGFNYGPAHLLNELLDRRIGPLISRRSRTNRELLADYRQEEVSLPDELPPLKRNIKLCAQKIADLVN